MSEIGCYNEPKNACIDRVERNYTVEENIDNKIQALRNEIDRLEKSKETLGVLLPLRIRDIRDAMNY